jgi:hypothetical protein
MIRAAVQHLGVQIGAGVIDETREEILEQLSLQIAYVNNCDLLIVNQRRAAPEIYRNHGQRLIHGLEEIASAINASPISQCSSEEISEHDACVFDSVMLIDIEIAISLQFEIEAAMFAEQLEHVIQEADAGQNLIRSPAFDNEATRDAGFLRFAIQAGFSHLACE